MELLTQQQREEMIRNHRANEGREHRQDFRPVVKLFCPWNLAVWLFTELNPNDLDVAYGLYDSGESLTELGRFRLSELAEIRGPDDLRVERDARFNATEPLSFYARRARGSRRNWA